MLQIPSAVLAQMHAHLAHGYPNEACGLLLGLDIDLPERDGMPCCVVQRLELVANVADKPSAFESHTPGSLRNRYLISPDDYVRADRAARAVNLDIVGVFHSHPDHAAMPSAEDLRTAWPCMSYVIVSVARGVVHDTRSWRLATDGARFEPEIIEMCEAAPGHH